MQGSEPIEPPGFMVVQPCVRTQSLLLTDVDATREYMSSFKMCGAFSPVSDYHGFAAVIWDFFRKTLGCEKENIRIHGANRHRALLAPWEHRGEDPKLLLDTFPDSYYEWEFGVDRISGHGLTIALRMHHSQSFRDVGNIMEVCRDGAPIAYGLGFGLETLVSRLHHLEKPLLCAPVSTVIAYEKGACERYADLAQLAVVLYRAGVRPNRTHRGAIAVKTLQALLACIDHLRMPFDSCLRHFSLFEEVEFGNQTGVSRAIVADLKRLEI